MESFLADLAGTLEPYGMKRRDVKLVTYLDPIYRDSGA